MKNIYLLPVCLFLCLACNEKDPQVQNTVEDIDGNVYSLVKIGEQTWMKENLKTTRLNDGTVLAMETDSTTWFNLNTAAYCWYENNSSHANTKIGALYNQFAVATDKLCPAGWHVASDEDFIELEMFLGMSQATAYQKGWRGTDEAKKLKSVSDWGTDFPGTDEVGFNAVPTGVRGNWEDGLPGFSFKDEVTNIITSNNYVPEQPVVRQIDAWGDDIGRFISSNLRNGGFTVRCIKDK